MIRSLTPLLAVLVVTLVAAPPLFGQEPEDDAVLKPAEPDFTLVALPTSLRVPRLKSAFRVTHRFTRPLNQEGSDFGDLAGDLFGLDGGAQIGLEYRFGILPNGQIGMHRTSDKTIELFGEYGLTRQGSQMPFETAVFVSIEGTNNFQDEYSPAIGLILARRVGASAAFYFEPIFVGHSNVFEPRVNDDNTFMIGLGARVRVRPTVYLVGEFTPRVSGYAPFDDQGSFAIEKRAGGHVFQLNFSNAFGTTMGQIARQHFAGNNWYMGFNISRKFF